MIFTKELKHGEQCYHIITTSHRDFGAEEIVKGLIVTKCEFVCLYNMMNFNLMQREAGHKGTLKHFKRNKPYMKILEQRFYNVRQKDRAKSFESHNGHFVAKHSELYKDIKRLPEKINECMVQTMLGLPYD